MRPTAVVRGVEPSITRQMQYSQSEWVTPLAKFHRPETRYPPLASRKPPAARQARAYMAAGHGVGIDASHLDRAIRHKINARRALHSRREASARERRRHRCRR